MPLQLFKNYEVFVVCPDIQDVLCSRRLQVKSCEFADAEY
jgi:hypothetical protein